MNERPEGTVPEGDDPDIPAGGGSGDDALIEDALIEDAPMEDVPMEDVPMEDVPMEDMRSDDAPIEHGEGELIEGELVEPSTAAAVEADALLAEALDAESIEAQFLEAEARAQATAEAAATGGAQKKVLALTADLQRVHAEYANYRKRVERDRDLVRQRAVEAALVELLPVLDAIGRAREHDELVGAFRAVGESLEAALSKLGMTPFGATGEAFDPTRHEALMRQSVEGVTEPTVVAVFQAGYEMNGRVIRPARVAVAGTD